MSKELQTILVTISPIEGEWGSIVLDPAKNDLGNIASYPISTRRASSPMVVHVKNLGKPLGVGYDLEVRSSWPIYDEGGTLENSEKYMTIIYGIKYGALEIYNVAVDHSKHIEDLPYKLGEEFDIGCAKRYEVFAPKAHEELIAIGRAIAQKLNMNIALPEADKARGF